MFYRKTWHLCFLIAVTILVLINFSLKQPETVYFEPSIQKWHSTLIQRWIPPYDKQDGTKMPKVNIEVNGHSISFKNISIQPIPQRISIHLVFHSHVDPGWLRTFEEYYQEKVKNILSNAVEALKSRPTLRFIWSETSFLERWWREATAEQKEEITRQIKTGQLEISGGAWVMTDEATPTFYAAIENLIEGHQFIKEQFNITPRTSWSVDPFGHGSMMPQLFHLSGINSMVIARIHEHLKQQMRNNQALRWKWIAPYSKNIEGPVVNSLPRYTYTTFDACEDRKICHCYHVGPSAVLQNVCPDKQLINKMTAPALDYVTRRFIEQVRKSQSMYGTEDVLVPIGDDFFFGDPKDWREMYDGFGNMMDWLNMTPEIGAEMKFSTVSEFFDSIKSQELPTLRGDFFSYSSDPRDKFAWWTGFFVHRAVTKAMERRLQNCLRSLDIATMLSPGLSGMIISEIKVAKRNFTLFQHHDGITGTSKPEVMTDFEERMKSSFAIFYKLFSGLLSIENASFTFDGVRNKHVLIEIPQNSSMFLHVFSSQTRKSKQWLKILVDREVKIRTRDGEVLVTNFYEIQLENRTAYEARFIAELKPLSITSFIVYSSTEKSQNLAESAVKCWKFNKETQEIEGLPFQGELFSINISFFEVHDDGGAYVIAARNETKLLLPKNISEISSHRLEFSEYPNKGLKMRSFCHSEGEVALEIESAVSMNNILVLEIRSGIQSEEFFTDVNGMYHLSRKYSRTLDGTALPWEANIFPVATSTFIQDKNHRLTIITAQPTGAVLTPENRLQLLVDRQITGNDGKGLSFGDAYDNRSTTVRYRILLEKREDFQSFLTRKGEEKVSEVLYPPILMVSPFTNGDLSINFAHGAEIWPCDIQLVSWRLLSEKIGLLILRRLFFDKTNEESSCSDRNMEDLFHFFSIRHKSLWHAKLTATKDLEEVTVKSFMSSLSDPLSIAAFRLYL